MHDGDNPDVLIAQLGLVPHPEGGLYRELHRSPLLVRRSADGHDRAALTVIAYLLRQGERSRWHRVNGADEVWHYGAGAPLELWRLAPEAERAEPIGLGPLAPPTAQGGEGDGSGGPAADGPMAVIPAGWWQAARSRGAWTLVYCCVGPGFDFADFELLADCPPPQRPAGALEAWI